MLVSSRQQPSETAFLTSLSARSTALHTEFVVRWSLVSEFGRNGCCGPAGQSGKVRETPKYQRDFKEILNWTILNMKAFEKACDAGARTVQGNGIATLVLMQLQCAWIVFSHKVACIARMGSILQHIKSYQHPHPAASSLQVKLHHRSSQLNPELWEMYIIAALTKSKEVCCFFAVMYFLTFPHINLRSRVAMGQTVG